jgi:molybdopterin synthase sulfur carrier subunit
VRVRFFAYLRNITGCAEADLPYAETAGSLARSLCELYGDKLRQKFFPPEISLKAPIKSPPEKLGPEIIFLINGRHINHLGGLDTPLKPDDRVDIFPVVAGG